MKIAQRIHIYPFLEDEAFGRLLAFLEEYRDCFDELTITTDYHHHGAIPLSELRPQAEILAREMSRYTKIPVRTDVLRRVEDTLPMKNMESIILN